jgi:hypothetical protein
MTSHKHIDIDDACFITYVILDIIRDIILDVILDIIQPKEIPQGHLW